MTKTVKELRVTAKTFLNTYLMDDGKAYVLSISGSGCEPPMYLKINGGNEKYKIVNYKMDANKNLVFATVEQ